MGARASVENGIGCQTHDGVMRPHHPWAVRFAPSAEPEPAPKPVRRHRKPDVPRWCRKCGKEFTVRPSELKRGRGKYCSQSCAGTAGNDVRVQKVSQPTVQLRALAPGTKFRIETTEAEVVRQSPASAATVVKYLRESKTEVLSTWCSSVNVRVL